MNERDKKGRDESNSNVLYTCIKLSKSELRRQFVTVQLAKH